MALFERMIYFGVLATRVKALTGTAVPANTVVVSTERRRQARRELALWLLLAALPGCTVPNFTPGRDTPDGGDAGSVGSGGAGADAGDGATGGSGDAGGAGGSGGSGNAGSDGGSGDAGGASGDGGSGNTGGASGSGNASGSGDSGAGSGGTGDTGGTGGSGAMGGLGGTGAAGGTGSGGTNGSGGAGGTSGAGGAGGSAGTGGTGGTGGSGGSAGTGTGGSGGTGGSAGTSGSGGASCETTGFGSLQDSFAGPDFSSLWSVEGDGTSSIVAGRARLQLTPDMDSLARLTIQDSYSLIDCAVAIELVTALGAAVDGQASLVLWYDTDNFLTARVESGRVSLYTFDGGDQVANVSFDYDPTLDRWFRISESGGEVSYQTSEDAQTWNTWLTHPTPSVADQLSLWLDVSTFSPVTDPGYAEFDNLNLLP